jgi:hypothetical protein
MQLFKFTSIAFVLSISARPSTILAKDSVTIPEQIEIVKGYFKPVFQYFETEL